MVEQRETKEKGVWISFGDVYEYNHEPYFYKFVITDLGESGNFISFLLVEKNGNEILGLEGIAGPEYIHRFTGKRSLEQVITALERSYQEHSNLSRQVPKQQYIDNFTKNSYKEPRFIPFN